MGTGLRFLVVGSDGRIGSALYSMLKAEREDVVGTTRKVNCKPHLDLLHPDEIPECDVAFLCAAILADYHEKLWSTNVEGTLQVIRRLLDRGAFPVFLSSLSVLTRRNDYALSKIAVEASEEASRIAIVRLGSVTFPPVRPYNLPDCLKTLVSIGKAREPGVYSWGSL